MRSTIDGDLVIGGARNTDPDTSHEAGGVTSARINQALLLLHMFDQHPDGLTAVEAGILAGLERPDRRVSDLYTNGHVEWARDDDGRPMKRTPFSASTQRIRRGHVLRITAKGQARLEEERA